MKLTLPNSVSSLEDVRSLTLEVREYARWFAHNAIKKQVGAKNVTEAPTLSPAAKELLRSWTDKQPLTSSRLDELIATLDHFKDTASALTITLAAPASASLKQELVGWCRKNLASDILVSFQFNSTLLGGMVVRCGSRIFDWSFRPQLLNNRKQFPEIFRHV